MIDHELQEKLLLAISESAYADELLENEPTITDTGVVVGRVEALPGLDKPVLRDATTKRKLPGSGQYARKSSSSTAVVQVGAVLPSPTSYRATPEYRQKFEELFPTGGDIEDRGSLAWWFDQAWSAAEGSPQEIQCPHPEWHTEKEHRGTPVRHVVAFKKDGSLIFKMIELAVGKATQTQNINMKEERLVKVLEQRTVDVKVLGISADDVDHRMKAIEAFGYPLLTEETDGYAGADSWREAGDAASSGSLDGIATGAGAGAPAN